ncbi:MAG: S1 RNA-binding domain-containing protein [Candidatus Blackburnbacteria bacterium]|nr:S1 RNA-binding domain-containing protein [Candidatus Blackburnbacteria bacterium]
MEELLAKTGYTPRGLSRGQEVSGTVISISSKSLVLDIGAKSEGLVLESEFDMAKPFIKTLSPGDKVQAMVVVPEGEGGYTILSLRQNAQDFVWKTLEEKRVSGEEVEVKVEGATRGGLTTSLYGIGGFVPTSHLSGDLVDNLNSAVGKNLQVKIIEADRAKERLVLSEKAVSQKEFLDKQKEVLAGIKTGEKFTGRVTKVVSFGVFVEIVKNDIPVEGLVHLSEIAWNKVVNPVEVLAEGDEVEVVVIGREDKLALSIKQTQEDPWVGISAKYHKDDQITGKVAKVGDYGAFIELEAGIQGLLSLAKIPAGRSLAEGEDVKAFIEDIDEKSHKLSLGLVLTSVPVGYR